MVTHTDGHNASGNIHTHIVINSVRKLDVVNDSFAERECDRKAGYKHHLTKDYLHHLEKSVMEMCEQKGFHQVDLLNPAPVKITQSEYWAKRRGQKRLAKTNEEIIADGLKPRNTEFKTGKQTLRDAIDDIAQTAISYDHFSELLMEKYEIEIQHKRGRFGYKAKGIDRYTTEKHWEHFMEPIIFRKYLNRIGLRQPSMKRIIIKIHMPSSTSNPHCDLLLICRLA